MTRFYMAVPTLHGRYAVRMQYTLAGDLHVTGCRDFDTFEDADECARRIAAGEFPEIAPAGHYVDMR